MPDCPVDCARHLRGSIRQGPTALHLLDQLVDLVLKASAALALALALGLGSAVRRRRPLLQHGGGIARRLPLDELGVDPLLRQQVVVAAALDDDPLVHDRDLVRVDHRGQAVRDEHDGATGLLDELVQRLLHQRFVLRVQRRCRLVEEEQPGLPEEAPGNGEALALAAGEQHAALADARVVLVLGLQDELVRVGGPASVLELLAGVGAPEAVGQVLLDGLREELRVLRDEAAHRADGSGREGLHVLPVEEQVPRRRLVEAHQQVHQGALAAAALADEGRHAARLHVQVDAVQHEVLRARPVAELHALQLQVPHRGVAVDHFALVGVVLGARVDERDHALRGGGRADEVVEDVAQGDEGGVHHVPVQLVGDQTPDAHGLAVRVAHLRAAVPQDEDRGAQVEVRGEGADGGADVGVLLAVLQRRADALPVLLHLVQLRGEAADGADVVDGLRRAAVGLAIGAVDGPVDLPAPLGVLAVGVRDRRHHGQREHRQLPGRLEGHHHTADQQHHVGHEIVHQGVQRLHHLARIVGQPGGDLARVHGVEEGDVHPQDALEQLDPDAACELAQHEVLGEGLQAAEGPLHQVHAEVQQHHVLEVALALARVLGVADQAVEDHAGDVGRPDLHRLRPDEAHDRQGRHVPELQGQGEDALEVRPRRQLLAVLPHRPGAVAPRVGVVLFLVAPRAQVEVARPAAVGDVVGSLHAFVADVALVALQANREEQRMHVDVGHELPLLLRDLRQVLAQHEVLHVDAEHDDAEQDGLRRLEALVVLKANTLQAVVHRHRCRNGEVHRHDDSLPRVRLLHEQGMAPLRLLDGDRRRGGAAG
mmetsp:Transcript_17792/g.50704  ORF Transcript_17792/g.50704 Transcript_17792/m.50704 type:complete len:823 (-) Transcript_17792:445-2913(-)